MKKIDPGQDIRAMRKRLKLTQGQLAALFNKTEPTRFRTCQKTISQYELGNIRCFADTYLKFMRLEGESQCQK